MISIHAPRTIIYSIALLIHVYATSGIDNDSKAASLFRGGYHVKMGEDKTLNSLYYSHIVPTKLLPIMKDNNENLIAEVMDYIRQSNEYKCLSQEGIDVVEGRGIWKRKNNKSTGVGLFLMNVNSVIDKYLQAHCPSCIDIVQFFPYIFFNVAPLAEDWGPINEYKGYRTELFSVQNVLQSLIDNKDSDFLKQYVNFHPIAIFIESSLDEMDGCARLEFKQYTKTYHDLVIKFLHEAVYYFGSSCYSLLANTTFNEYQECLRYVKTLPHSEQNKQQAQSSTLSTAAANATSSPPRLVSSASAPRLVSSAKDVLNNAKIKDSITHVFEELGDNNTPPTEEAIQNMKLQLCKEFLHTLDECAMKVCPSSVTFEGRTMTEEEDGLQSQMMIEDNYLLFTEEAAQSNLIDEKELQELTDETQAQMMVADETQAQMVETENVEAETSSSIGDSSSSSSSDDTTTEVLNPLLRDNTATEYEMRLLMTINEATYMSG